MGCILKLSSKSELWQFYITVSQRGARDCSKVRARTCSTLSLIFPCLTNLILNLWRYRCRFSSSIPNLLLTKLRLTSIENFQLKPFTTNILQNNLEQIPLNFQVFVCPIELFEFVLRGIVRIPSVYNLYNQHKAICNVVPRNTAHARLRRSK